MSIDVRNEIYINTTTGNKHPLWISLEVLLEMLQACAEHGENEATITVQEDGTLTVKLPWGTQRWEKTEKGV